MSFTSQKYKKYFTLNHNGPKNVRTVQTIASIGVEMMPAGTDVDCGWVYINKVGLRCMNAFSRRAACRGEDAAKSLVPFSGLHPMRRCVGADVAERGLGTMADLWGVLFFSCFCPLRSIPLCNNVCVDNHTVSVCLTAVCEC